MRLWSLHPKYLDSKGLVAVWREGLLAKAVLEGKTRGYRSHPQLRRFRAQEDPVAAIDAYLHAVLEEARRRGYHFDETKLSPHAPVKPIEVSVGQLRYEWRHLLFKLKRRDPARFQRLCTLEDPDPHPLMRVVPGDIEAWEVVH
ncbi:pyrimidine dimer DNA glycosylase/endonuclease V [Spirochaeta thermophila]|uniref:Pyrimidine dimer DNA glycosylase n=1 Tax=Winmispira thermophila (strain ATCC 49972 / DSM 6192 / RI 19.B1) TaxID=665571 RepID=E0RSX7_WINT6|nr:pyrimidine dimer DNA glycosylase/endonuclease V [Spirochaeta thermophila]ADN02114.1 pyrimidine dimer DNA glycosylase [Spirochaeta thermophila DSM 6192]